MIYTLYFLYSLLIVLFTYRYLFLLRLPEKTLPIDQPTIEKNQEEVITLNGKKKLLHEDFLRLINKLDYLHDDGICFGFTLVWALDNLRKKGDRFNLFIQLIRAEKSVLPKKLFEIRDKIRRREPLDNKEQQLIQLPSFIERICIAHLPHHYADIYKKKLEQTYINAIIHIIDEEFETSEAVERFFSKTYSFSSNSKIANYFFMLQQAVDDNTFMLLSTDAHTVGLKKIATGWLFLDITYLYQQSLKYPHFVLNSDELVQQLRESFEQCNTICFTIDFIASNASYDLKKRLHQFDRNHPILCKQLLSHDSEMDLLSISIINGDHRTISNIIKLNNERKLLSPEQIGNAIYWAIKMNQRESLKLLIKTPGFKINRVCYDGSSPLGIAAFFGKVQLVALLLSCPGVNVNFFNARKETPLLLAAGSAYTYQNTALFRLLLESGAYYRKKALMIAVKHENEAAIGVIKKFRAEPDSYSRNIPSIDSHYTLFRSPIKQKHLNIPSEVRPFPQ